LVHGHMKHLGRCGGVDVVTEVGVFAEERAGATGVHL